MARHEIYRQARDLKAGDVFQLLDEQKKPFGQIYVVKEIVGVVVRSGVYVLFTNNGNVNIPCDQVVLVTAGE